MESLEVVPNKLHVPAVILEVTPEVREPLPRRQQTHKGMLDVQQLFGLVKNILTDFLNTRCLFYIALVKRLHCFYSHFLMWPVVYFHVLPCFIFAIRIVHMVENEINGTLCIEIAFA